MGVCLRFFWSRVSRMGLFTDPEPVSRDLLHTSRLQVQKIFVGVDSGLRQRKWGAAAVEGPGSEAQIGVCAYESNVTPSTHAVSVPQGTIDDSPPV